VVKNEKNKETKTNNRRAEEQVKMESWKVVRKIQGKGFDSKSEGVRDGAGDDDDDDDDGDDDGELACVEWRV